MSPRVLLAAVLSLGACATTTQRPGTEDWAQERYKSAVTSCDSAHAFDQAQALSVGATMSVPDAKYQACLAKAQANLDHDMAVVNGTAK